VWLPSVAFKFSRAMGMSACHSGPAFTDGSFHNIGTPVNDELGRGQLFLDVREAKIVKSPTLRDVERRARPTYDGSVATLEESYSLYDKGGIDRPCCSSLKNPLSLNADERQICWPFFKPHRLKIPTPPR
jgi:cytochrome c peroxidase